MDLRQIVESTTLVSDRIAALTALIHGAALSKSEFLDGPNFRRLAPLDLRLLFEEYDTAFFGGQIKETLGQVSLDFSLSKRLTSAAGKTTALRRRSDGHRSFEISVSLPILARCFLADDHRPISASGILCRDRLEALQRVMEHEIIHLMEILLWDKSSCRGSRFHSISRRFFGHTQNTHQLITPRERAIAQFGIKPGMKVRFRFDGVEQIGIVNRISKRATVLVESEEGQPYSNGKRYAKYYIPVESLQAAD